MERDVRRDGIPGPVLPQLPHVGQYVQEQRPPDVVLRRHKARVALTQPTDVSLRRPLLHGPRHQSCGGRTRGPGSVRPLPVTVLSGSLPCASPVSPLPTGSVPTLTEDLRRRRPPGSCGSGDDTEGCPALTGSTGDEGPWDRPDDHVYTQVWWVRVVSLSFLVEHL